MARELEKLRLTRRQVARREIDTAIELLFTDGDPIAVNLLAWAAVDVLRGISDARGRETFMGRLEKGVRPEFIAQWRKLLKDHHNFLKHSMKDSDRVLENFVPEAATWTLLAGIEDYGGLYQQVTFPMHMFRAWFFVRNPNLLVDGAWLEVHRLGPALGGIDQKPFRDSLQAAADVFQIFKSEPQHFHDKFDTPGSAIEW